MVAMPDTQKTPVLPARAAVALPAAGLYDAVDAAAGTTVNVRGIDEVSFYFTYTQGAVGGQAQVKVMVLQSEAATSGFEDPVIDESTYVAGVVQLDRSYELKLPVSIGALPERFRIPYKCAGDLFLRLVAKEIGVVGTPGILRVDWSGGDV